MKNAEKSAILAVFLVLYLAAPLAAGAGFCEGSETRTCGTNVGACKYGTSTCINGEWSECKGGVQPADEVCDNKLDDNCNGLTDECLSFFSPYVLIPLTLLGFVALFVIAKLS